MALSTTSVNNFSSLLMDNLVVSFGLKINNSLVFESKISEENQSQFLSQLIKESELEINYWNEQELVMKHIAPILNFAHIKGENYNTFAERNLSAKVDDYLLSGTVDFMVAGGVYNPNSPYFFIQEYKRFKQGSESDPQAQLLGEMLVAQKLNEDELVYGAYIVGRFWYFVVLQNREYSVSKPLDSVDLEDLGVIMAKLNWIKKYVEEKY